MRRPTNVGATSSTPHDSARAPWTTLATALWAGVTLAGEPVEGVTGDDGTAAPAYHCVMMPHAVVEVSAGVSGRIETLFVERGDRVEKDQLVAQLEAGVETANLALADARAAVDSEIHLRQARLHFDRLREGRVEMLHQQRVASSHERDEAQMNASIARWQLHLARDSQRLAQLELDRSRELLRLRTVRSPISGIITDRYRWPGEFVEEDPIVQVARLDPLRVEVIVPVAMHGRIRRGMRAEVIPEPDPETRHTATVALVDPMADPASGTFRVRLELPNPDRRLLSGIKCTTRFLPSVSNADMTSDFPPRDRARSGNPPPKVVPAKPQPDRDITPPRPETAAPESLQAASAGPIADGPPPPLPVTESHRGFATSLPPALPVTPTARPAAPEAQALSGGGCRAVGPLASAAKARQLADALGRHAVESKLRETTTSVPNGYIVLTAPARSTGEQRALARRLRAGGISDLQMLPRGVYAKRIALGVFDDRRVAEQRRDGLAARGFETEVVMRTRTRTTWWLDLTGDPLARIATALADTAPELAAGRAACDQVPAGHSMAAVRP